MKKLTLIAALLMTMLAFTSCGKDENETVSYKSFVGTWGVEKIIYENYNTDYAGNPIQGSMETETYVYDPTDIDNGIQLVFKKDKTGEMRDNDIDSLPKVVDGDTIYIQCSDTTLVYPFTYSYDKDEAILYMNMSYARTYMMSISDLTDDSFVYKNNYGMDEDNRVYFETAYMKRLSATPSKSASRQKAKHPLKPGSFLGSR